MQLADLSKYKNGVKYLLVCVDLFSRFAWVKPLKTKTSRAVADAMQEIINYMKEDSVSRGTFSKMC